MVKGKAPLDKGGQAEEALADYFRAGGFFAVRGIPFRYAGEDLTDIDVWLYERGGGLGRRRFIVDSKNRKVPRVVERLFWTSGLRDALALDGAFVATVGARDAAHRLGRRLGISIIDLQALAPSVGIESLRDSSRISRTELDALVASVDRQRESRDWREHLDLMLAGLLTSFGGSSANIALRAARFYAEQALGSAPNSQSASIATRLFFLAAAIAAVSLDYVAAQSAFRPADQRRRDLEDVVRFGSDPAETRGKIELALELVRQYLPNGAAASHQISERIHSSSLEMPADMIAEVVHRMMSKGTLFEAARALESAAYQRDLRSFTQLGADARSFAGVVLDFVRIDRAYFAQAWSPMARSTSPEIARHEGAGASGTLFDERTDPNADPRP